MVTDAAGRNAGQGSNWPQVRRTVSPGATGGPPAPAKAGRPPVGPVARSEGRATTGRLGCTGGQVWHPVPTGQDPHSRLPFASQSVAYGTVAGCWDGAD